jgi:glycosyltransferase involved in cell wall biosynthesis
MVTVADPLVSVVVPAYNAARYIGAALDSALSQTYANLELVVVDDGSTDGTAAIVQGYGDRVRYVYQANARQAAARNRGVRESSGEVVAFLDADDLWLPDKLEKQIELLRRHPEAGLIFCGLCVINAEGILGAERIGKLRGDPIPEILLGKVICAGIGSTALVRRDVLEVVGGFDPELPPCEDIDLFLRIATRFPVHAVNEALVHYRLHGENAHSNVERMTQAWKLLFKKAFHDPSVRRLGLSFRLRALGRLYYMLSGDYWHTGRRDVALMYALQACLLWPPTVMRLAGLAKVP